MVNPLDTSSPSGMYHPSSPHRTGFKGGIPKVFLFAGIPMMVLFSLLQIHFAQLYSEPPLPRILKRATQRSMQISTLNRSQDNNGGKGMDDFGIMAAEIQNGKLRTIRKTLKDAGTVSKTDRKSIAKELFDSIMSEMNAEVSDIEQDGAFVLERNGRSRFRKRPNAWKMGPVVKPPSEFPKSTVITAKNADRVMEVLEWEYNVMEKEVPFVGDLEYIKMHPNDGSNAVSRKFTNSLVTAPWPTATRKHGLVGVDPTTGKQWWNPAPMPALCSTINEAECTTRLKAGGGFDLTMSDAKALDRLEPINHLSEPCSNYAKSIDIEPLGDISITITFFNEPLSTLLRTVHSVLNTTPPPLLREIILVDDHSTLKDNISGGPLDDAIRYLPKVKILRQPERRGLVMGRIAGIHNSLGSIAVVLDSHVEMNEYWAEPLLQRILEEPKAVVFPIIAGIEQTSLEPMLSSGIGTWLTWQWTMVESATFKFPPLDIAPVPSPSMAGGLFAVRRDYFFELGAYDEQMAMWGAENVEMPFRVWQCGGRVEGIPCSTTYHIYRKGGIGYTSPSASIMMNRLRTARLWMDEWYEVAKFFILFGANDPNKETAIIGNMDEMLAFKQEHKCKGFKWFLDTVDPTHQASSLSDVLIMGSVRSMKDTSQCLDIHGKRDKHDLVGTFTCHGQGSSQAFFSAPGQNGTDKSHSLMSALNAKNCINRIHPLDKDGKPIEKDFGKAGIVPCDNAGEVWNQHDIEFITNTDVKEPEGLAKNSRPARLVETDTNHPEYGKRCLTKFSDKNNTTGNLAYEPCREEDLSQMWWVEKRDLEYVAPTISPRYLDNLKLQE